MDLSYFTIAAFFSGTGELTVFGGVQVATGLSIEDMYALLASVGCGLDYCVGGGVLVHTGTSERKRRRKYINKKRQRESNPVPIHPNPPTHLPQNKNKKQARR